MSRASAVLIFVLAVPLCAVAQDPPNRDYQPPFKGEAVFDPRPEKRAAAAAEAERKAAEEAAAIEAATVKTEPAPATPPQEPAASPAPEAAPMPVAEGYVPPSPEALAAAEAALRKPPRTPVENPRAYGYLVGDLLVQKVQLSVDGKPVELAELPGRDRYGVWIARRATQVERHADGTRWLVMEYQIVNASKDVDVIALPKLKLRTTTPDLFIDVPDWPISVGAITAVQISNKGALRALQPDRPAPVIDTEAIRHPLKLTLAALAAVLLAWLAWWRWREWQASERLPFARARRELRHLSPDSEADSDAAWRCLHQAFDATAGRVVQPATLALLFRAAPHLEAARDVIERFYAESAARFFGGRDHTSLSPNALCAQLRAIEKQHEA
ncbi:hypothetical protein [Nevskia ramosa]|uniref:hypothetical protein n=1 Tax=Nevskia ramosa TaxID=64002 RepID=UPI002357EEFA|nr:hypothetical protein [Nevskia ramosa]